MKKNHTFKSNLLLSFTISIFIPTLVILVIIYSYFTNTLTNQKLASFENTLNSVSSNIDTYLDDLQRLTLTPYMYNGIFNYMSYLNNNLENINSNNMDLYSMTKNYSSTLNKLINSSRKDLMSISFIPINDTSKHFLVSKYFNLLTEVELPSYYKEWIDNTINLDGDIYFTPVYNTKYPNSQNEYKVFSLMRVIKNLDTNTVIGIIKVDAKENTLKQIISSINMSNNSEFLLLDENKEVIYSTKPMLDDFNALDYYNTKSKTYYSTGYNILEKSIKSNGWTLLYLDSKHDSFLAALPVLLILILFAIIFVLGSIFLFRLKATKMVDSMYEIKSTMEKLESGDNTINSNISGNLEFEFISSSINKIAEKINLHVKNEYDAILKQKKAEYITLQTQINPHFLNNILNGFIALNRLNEKELLENSLIQLSQFYRYTCENSYISTLEDEYYCIEKYLALEKIRFDDLIDFELTLSQDTKDIKIPKLILQPLVENAVKHGLKETYEPIIIKISSSLVCINNETSLIITIKDNGAGFDMSKCASSSSTGIKNIKERLQLFESTSNLQITSILNSGTTCTITLPIKEDSNYDYFIS